MKSRRPVNSDVRHLVLMSSDALTCKIALIDKSPFVFATALVVFVAGLWHAPISFGYLLVAAGLGLLFGFGFVFAYATTYVDLMLAVWPIVLIIAQIVSRYIFFSSAEREAAPWSTAVQFFGLAYVLTFGFAWAFRNRIISSLPR